MRLGQLSRQVGISQKEIVSFLKKEKGIELKVHPNVKVEDELTEIILENFAKPITEDKASEAEPEEQVAEEKPSKTKAIERVVAALQTKAVEVAPEEKSEEVAEPKEYVQGEEFVRPSGPIEKIETEIPKLEGFKVIGKIDLPQFHKEEPAPDKAPEDVSAADESIKDASTSEENDAPIELPNATPLFNSRPKRRPKKEKIKPSERSKKPIVSEEDRKQKELEKAEKQRLAAKKAKKAEARKRHLELVKSYDTNQKTKDKPSNKTSTKFAKNPKAAAIEELKSTASKTSLGHKVSDAPSKPKNEPKTFIGKIWRWMNTE